MGVQSSSQPKRLIRSISFNSNQRETYRDFDVQLFKIDCEVKFTPQLEYEKICEIKQKLYCLRKEFDASRMKEKYEIEFRLKYRKVVDNLEQRVQTVRRKARKKRLAPSPPGDQQIEDLQNEITQIRAIVNVFCGRRDGDKHMELQQAILGLLFQLGSLQAGSDRQKYYMIRELLEILKQLERNAVENCETVVNCN